MRSDVPAGWTTKSSDEFVGHLAHEVGRTRPGQFALLLGAGASASSGIPVASKLVADWLVELYHQSRSGTDQTDYDPRTLDAAIEWASERFPEVPFDREALGAAYSTVILERHPSEEARQRTFHELCAAKRPGFGYAAIALLMSGAYKVPAGQALPRDAFNVALTTNFDDLLTVALHLWGHRRPLVVNHDGLARFASVTSPDPIVVHLHGAYQTELRNTTSELATLRGVLSGRVRNLLSDRDLVVIGYGGHDPGVSKLLASVDDYRRTVWWLSRRPPSPSDALNTWLDGLSSKVWVPIDSFDRFAFALGVRLGISIPDEQRTADYLRSVSDDWSNQTKDHAPGEIRKSIRQQNQQQRTVYDVMLAAHAEADPKRSDKVWTQALSEPRFAHDARLLGGYAVFLATTKRDDADAEKYFKIAIDADPTSSTNLSNYAIFLKKRGSDDDHIHAEELFERALDADPSHAEILGSYATFLSNVRTNYDRAEELFQRALDADPGDATNLGNYAVFLRQVRDDNRRAEDLFRRAVSADPTDASVLCNYAAFLTEVDGDNAHAHELFERAVAAAPDDARVLGNFAFFLTSTLGDHDRAENLFERAIGIEPSDAFNLGRYAVFLTGVRQDHVRASELFERAIAADDQDASNFGNYALFLSSSQAGSFRDYELAEELYERATNLGADNATLLGSYAAFLSIREHHDRAQELFEAAIEADPYHAVNLGNFALFLSNDLKDHDRAEEFFERAIAAHPPLANNFRIYADFQANIRGNQYRARKLRARALELDPEPDERD